MGILANALFEHPPVHGLKPLGNYENLIITSVTIWQTTFPLKLLPCFANKLITHCKPLNAVNGRAMHIFYAWW